MHEPTYDEHARKRRLVELLRALSARIRELEEDEALLAAGPELLRLLGDVRSELFQYEVRVTYDSPEVAESRKIVEEAQRQSQSWDPEDTEEDEEPWRRQ
ncbi:MAG: hypothetical protein PVH40_08870 [Gemmatimonadales bacterium]|jgi:hypothetical protein